MDPSCESASPNSSPVWIRRATLRLGFQFYFPSPSLRKEGMSIFYSLVHLPMSSLEINLEKVEPETAHHDKKSFEPPKCCTQFQKSVGKVGWGCAHDHASPWILLHDSNCTIPRTTVDTRAQCPQLQTERHTFSLPEFQSCSLCSTMLPNEPSGYHSGCGRCAHVILRQFILSISGFSTRSPFPKFRTRQAKDHGRQHDRRQIATSTQTSVGAAPIEQY